MKNQKFIALFLMLMLLVPAFAMAEVTDEQYAQWAVEHGYVLNPEENGYIKLQPDALSSATANKVGGVNYGAIEWSDELRVSAIKEFLKGGHYLGSADFAQDETGYNYREMYQMATSYNNVPYNTNLELVLDADSLNLLGVSEAGTSKTLQFMLNPYVSISWCRQLRPHEEDMYNYYCSYGVQYDGVVRVYTAKDLETKEGQDALINLFDKYYPTLASNWGAYSACFAGLTDEQAIREGKLAYITKSVTGGAMVIYEVIPTRIIITAPFLMNMSPSMANGGRFTQQQEGAPKYNYTLEISESFLDELVAFKNAYIATEEGLEAVKSYYSTGMYPMLDGLCATYGAPTSLDYALMTTNAAGIKTQTTYLPTTESEAGEKTGSAQGFAGVVTATVALAEDGTIASVALDTAADTAGSGAEVSKNEAFIAQFIGKTGPFAIGEGIDAVAGATLTSTGAVEAINQAIK